MPRRMITPEIWFNEKMSSLPDAGRLLFIGIFSNADDDGRLKASAKFLRAHIFPYDDKTDGLVAELRDKCAQVGLIRLYTNGTQEFLDIPGWHEHQQIRKDRYTRSKLPSFDEADETSSLNQPITFGYRPPTEGHAREEHAAQHTLAQQLQANEWQPTGEKIAQVETNKRLGNLYADIVATTESGYILIEVKLYPLQPKDLGQVLGYRREMESRQLTPITAFLIGGSLGKLTKEEAEQASVKVLNLRKLLVETTNQSVEVTGETTGNHSIVKSSLVKFNTPPKGGARTKRADPIVNEIFTEMRIYLDYPGDRDRDPIPNYAKEGQFIKKMLARHFTREEILKCWKTKVTQRRGEFVSMMWVNEDIADFMHGGEALPYKKSQAKRPGQVPTETQLNQQEKERGLR